MAKIRLRWGKVEDTGFSNPSLYSLSLGLATTWQPFLAFRDQFVHPPQSFKNSNTMEPDCMRRTLCSSLDIILFRSNTHVHVRA